MQGMLHKKEGTHRTICPRCGTENITAQDHCGKCGFIFPKGEKDAKKALGGGTPTSSIPGAPRSVAVAPGGAVDATGAQAGQEAPKIKTAHGKLDAHAEGLITERGAWEKCPRCEADVKAGATRCPHCGWKVGKK